jgi:3-methyladenine DNA glycosylase AlkD
MEYLDPIRESFEQHADPGRAVQMSAYMRHKSAFYGIAAPIRKEISREFIRNNGLPGKEQLESLVDYAWKQPEREWQYAVMEILERFARKGDEALLPVAEFMITQKSWWDTVDYIAPNIAGAVLKKHPERIPYQTERWMNSGNLWLQRACLLFQLKYRNETDQELLFRLCERLSDHKDFFIRKAIGWALREYAKRNPGAVLEFVNSHTLSPLSRKEALKRIG